MHYQYRKVTVGRDGRIKGEKGWPSLSNPAETSWCRFTADRSLMLIQYAMDVKPNSITKFMDLADGYGGAGFFPGGYDWSGIRDSSPEAVNAMAALAEKLLGKKLPEFLRKDAFERQTAQQRAVALARHESEEAEEACRLNFNDFTKEMRRLAWEKEERVAAKIQ